MKGHLFNPEPRIGFAWDPFGQGKMSIRGGYGIFFEHGTGGEANTGSLEGSSPNVLNMTEQYPIGYNCIGGARPGATSCSAAASGAYPLNVTSIPTQVVWPYVQQWSFGVQRELPGQIVAGVAYVGSKGTHLSTQLQLNQLHPVSASLNPFQTNQTITTQTCSSTADAHGQNYFDGNNFNVNGILVGRNDPGFSNLTAACQGTGPLFPIDDTLRTFAPGFGNIYSLQNIADSHYHGLQMTLIRARGPLSFGVSYSYSHSFDDSSDRTDTTFVNSFDIASNRASSNFDQRHLLNVSYIYSFSFRSIGPMLGSIEKYLMTPLDAPSSASNAAPPTSPAQKQSSDAGWIGKLLDDWELSGITAHLSGTPFTIINGASPSGISVLDNAGVANGVGAGSYPDIVGNPYGPIPTVTVGLNSGSSIGPLLGNPNAFAAPRGLTFGNAGRNSFRNPSRTNFDMSLVKHYKFKEDRSLEFRIELFNVFNHTQFEIYDASKGNVNNTISCYGGTDPSGIETAGYVDPKGGVNCLAGSSFLHPVEAHRPRTMQFGLKYMF
jgi:hypothetical protein